MNPIVLRKAFFCSGAFLGVVFEDGAFECPSASALAQRRVDFDWVRTLCALLCTGGHRAGSRAR